MSDTKIEWADKVWNPIVGCTKCSPGCLNCYAERMAKRLYWMGMEKPATLPEYMKFKDGWKDGHIELCNHRLDQPLHWRKPCRIFVCSMSDLFHPKVPFEFIDKVMFTIYKSYKLGHTFQILTKRVKRMQEYFSGDVDARILELFRKSDSRYTSEHRLTDSVNMLPRVWLGVSISTFDEMWKAETLSEIPAAVRWISFEPLLENIFNIPCKLKVLDKIDGFIVGGESGPGARPMHPDWPRNIRDQCVAAGVPFYFKQWGEWGGCTRALHARRMHANDPKWHLWPDTGIESAVSIRVGKKKAGCLLDGKEWKQLPE